MRAAHRIFPPGPGPGALSRARPRPDPRGPRAMKIDRVAFPGVQRGNPKWLRIRSESDVTDHPFIQNFVNGFAIVDAAMRLSNHTRALRRRKTFRHDTPLKTRSGGGIAGAT